MLSVILKGIIIGFSIAAPVGPIGVLCIQRSLHEGYKAGLITGFGAACADGVYGAVAALGLTFISFFLLKHQTIIHLTGGIFLLYLGSKIFFSRPVAGTKQKVPHKSLLHIYTSSFFLTLTNPMTILSFMGIFAGLGLGSTYHEYLPALMLVVGVIFGSLAWWLILSSSIALIFHKKLTGNVLHRINQLSGLIIFVFGVIALIYRG